MPLKLTSKRWQQIQSIVDSLFDLERSEQLLMATELCGDDSQLLDEVVEVLKYQDGELTFLKIPAMDALIDGQPLEQNIEIDGYTLCERIGVGGMGVVYRAERDQDDFTQEVAIKLLPQWKDKHELRQRFRQEQQLLADLEHPCIAKLYGGGMTKEDLPYLIMEYVRGVPIDQYCSEHELGIPARLRLIKQVAKALEHAHSRLIVHRDIKPSNILVTADGKIKLLDFGIAKLIGEVDPNLTRTDDQVMTPGFAAPEQILNLPITVATDIYQLGLVSYLLLTGRQAHFSHADSVGGLIKAICEQTPDKPSGVVSQLHHALGELVSTSAWSNTLKGELDAVVLTMLRSHANERYASMAAVIADVDAYFEHRPISSLSQSSSYQVKKWLRRYRGPVAALTVFVVMITAYAITATIQARQIKLALEQSILERQKAQAVAELMVDMFKAADPNTAGIETITAQQLLEQGQRKIAEDLSLSPAIQAEMLTSIGEIYYSQGQIDKSREVLELALTKQKLVQSVNELELAKTLTNLAVIYNQTAAHKEAEELYQRSLALQVGRFADEYLDQSYIANLAETYNGYGVLLLDRGDLVQAANRIQEALKLLANAKLTHHEQYANSLSNLATIRITQGQLQEASSLMKEVINLQEQTTGETHPFFSLYLVSLANVLIKLEKFEQSRQYIDRAISLQLQVLGSNHPDLANSKRNLGVLLHHQGDLAGAEGELRESLLIREANFSKPSFMTAVNYRQLADVLVDQQRYSEAQSLYEKMSEHYLAVNAGGSYVGLGLTSKALAAYRQAFYSEAKVFYTEAIEMLSTNELRLAVAKAGYALSLLKSDDFDVALRHAKQALDIRIKKLPKHHSLIAEAEVIYGLTLSATGQESQAKVYLSRGVPVIERFPKFQFGGQDSLLSMGQRQLRKLPSNL